MEKEVKPKKAKKQVIKVEPNETISENTVVTPTYELLPPHIPTLEGHIESELKKFSIEDEVIGKWKEEFLPIKITSLEDKELIKKVVEARKMIKRHRVDVEKVREDIVTPAVKLQQAVNKKAKSITVELQLIENHLQQQEDFVEAEKERIKREKERLEQERVTNRSRKLISIGLVYDGVNYSYGEGESYNSISTSDIKSFDDLAFDTFVGKAEVFKKAEELARKERERIKKEEAEALAKRERELKEREEALAKKERELKAQQEATAKAETERLLKQAEEIKKQKLAEEVASKTTVAKTETPTTPEPKKEEQPVVQSPKQAFVSQEDELKQLQEYIAQCGVNTPIYKTEEAIKEAAIFKDAIRVVYKSLVVKNKLK